MVLVDNHWEIFVKEIKYVQEGCLSDPPGMEMYRVVLRTPGRLPVYRCLRTTAALEAYFNHYHHSCKPGAKGMGLETLDVHTNLFDWGWNVQAAEHASVIPHVGHSWLWLLDTLAAICQDLPDDTKPRSLRHWKPINTSQKPCTFRGVDWEVYNLHQESPIDVCSLHREQDIVAVLQFKDLVLRRDWEQLEEKTGIRTNAKALDSLITRAIDRGMSYPVALANGLDELRASLWTNAPEAPTGAQLPGMPSFSAAQQGPLPMAHVGTEHGPLPSVHVAHLPLTEPGVGHGANSSTQAQRQQHSSAAPATSTQAQGQQPALSVRSSSFYSQPIRLSAREGSSRCKANYNKSLW